MLKTFATVIHEMRPRQWTKNLLLFAGLLFAHHLQETTRVILALQGFLIFCGLSGVIYIFNDIHDAESDRQHPTKRHRPIASGALPIGLAWGVGIAVSAICLGWAYVLNFRFGAISTVYFILMLLYSIRLKHIVILDLMIVSIGFVIRAIAGVYAIEYRGETIPITPWFITCVMFLALFIVICKRRHEILLLAGSAHQHRPVLEHYSRAFLDQMVSVATAATVISYALYVTAGTPAGESNKMVFTLPFVLYGVFRYLYLVYKREEGGTPETLLLQDPSLLINVILWLATMIFILYG